MDLKTVFIITVTTSRMIFPGLPPTARVPDAKLTRIPAARSVTFQLYSSAKASAAIPHRKAAVRLRGTGFPGWTVLTRRTAHSHHPTATAMPSVGTGSNVQLNSSEATVGGSVGTAPWAATGPASTIEPATAATTAEARWGRRRPDISGIVA